MVELIIGGLIAIIIVIVVILLFYYYNRIRILYNRIEEAWAQIDVEFKKRYDLSTQSSRNSQRLRQTRKRNLRKNKSTSQTRYDKRNSRRTNRIFQPTNKHTKITIRSSRKLSNSKSKRKFQTITRTIRRH